MLTLISDVDGVHKGRPAVFDEMMDQRFPGWRGDLVPLDKVEVIYQVFMDGFETASKLKDEEYGA